MAKNIKSVVEEIAIPVAEKHGLLYVDTEYAKQGQEWVLTVFIDRKDGSVQLDDCEAVSREIESVLDEKDPIEAHYCLCVSSPGLDRPLRNARDYERSFGKEVDVKLYQSFNGQKVLTGTLSGYTEDTLTIETEDEEIVFELPEIAKVSLHLDI